MNIISLEEALTKIKEADVLLYRSQEFPKANWWIAKYTGGIHSHVGLAHKDRDDWYCVEQKEFRGGRSIYLPNAVRDNPNRIDVYRVVPVVYYPIFNGEIKWGTKQFDEEMAHRVTRTALQITGNAYGWKNVFKIMKGYAPFFRLKRHDKSDEEISQAYVCSTVVSYSYRAWYQDPCPLISDERTTPADIARSAILKYLFTIGTSKQGQAIDTNENH